MSTKLIIESITKHIRLSDEEKEQFISLLQPKTYKRKDFILEEGQVCKYSYFVTEGCLRGFTIDQNGFEHVLNFAPAGWWIADMYSLLTQKPGILNIEALENTEVLLLSKSRQEKLYTEIPQFERFFPRHYRKFTGILPATFNRQFEPYGRGTLPQFLQAIPEPHQYATQKTNSRIYRCNP